MTTKLISRGIVERALKDSKFKSLFPEFNSLAAFKAAKPTGCPTCRKSKQVEEPSVQLVVFSNIAASLNKDKLNSLKKYFNTDTLQYRVYDEVKTL